MTANLLTEVTALEAQAAANLFVSEHLPDRFCADDSRLDKAATLWRVPVVLAYPFIGSVGEVGEVEVDASSSEIVSHTAIDQMTARPELFTNNTVKPSKPRFHKQETPDSCSTTT